VSVFHRIEMHVIDMLRKIIVVPDPMFPEPPLPDASLAFAQA